jgi:hypothetical protein
VLLHPLRVFSLKTLPQVQALLSTLNMDVDRNTLLVHDITLYYSAASPSIFIPVDNLHPLMNTPRLASLIPGESRTDILPGRTFANYLWGDAATGVVPYQRQPNGMFLFAVAFHNSVNAPTISSSIPGSVNLQVVINAPSCNSRFGNGTAVSFTSSMRFTSVAPYTYAWISSRVRGHGPDPCPASVCAWLFRCKCNCK